jgi:hypothetical protein
MSKKKTGGLRVFKLRSGEEIIGKVESKTRSKIKVHRPMRVVTSIQADPFTGVKRHVVYFSDWLGSTSELSAELPCNFILLDMPPDPDLIELYDRQVESDNAERAATAARHADPVPPQKEEELMQSLEEADREIESLLKQYAEEQKNKSPFPPMPPLSGLGGMGLPGLGMPNIPTRPPNSIVFSVSIPQEILQSWVESGFLDYLKDSVEEFINTDFLEEMMNDDEDEVEDLEDDVHPKPKKPKKNKREKISKDKWEEPPAEKKENPQFGNSHEDWSPYIKDYLPDPPKKEDDA